MTEEEILDEHPDLEKADFAAVYHNGAEGGTSSEVGVKFLLDENLSPGLVNRLDELFPRLTHVREFGFKQSDDVVIFEWAKDNGFGIITTDSDLQGVSRRLGWPPKVIHLEHCDYPLRVIDDLLRPSAVLITQFPNDNRVGLLVRRAPNPMLYTSGP